MFDAKPSQPDVEIDLNIWLNLQSRRPLCRKHSRSVSTCGGISCPSDPTTCKEIQQNRWDHEREETITNDERLERESNLI
ncbi:MAG TPA: hypothetical protein VFV92_07015, partial [Candidatus Bathyarchaeia archaeon]|nr:hypothetical protein [Candidatus Bathyarchaeia archaeon]